MPKTTSYKISWDSPTLIMLDTLIDAVPDQVLKKTQGGTSYTVYTVDLSPIGFTGWKVQTTFHGGIGTSESEYVLLTNPNGISIQTSKFSQRLWDGGGEGYSRVRCTAVYDDNFDSLIVAFNSGVANRNDQSTPPTENTAVDKTAFVVLFLARDTKGGIFGGISYDGGGPSQFIGESGSIPITSSYPFKQGVEGNSFNGLVLASMTNWLDPDLPLAKNMMMSVTVPYPSSNDEVRFGTYYLLKEKKYGNLSTINPNNRFQLIDPWCPF